jgi:hypothetical protein
VTSALDKLNKAANQLEKVMPKPSYSRWEEIFVENIRTILGGWKRFSVVQSRDKIEIGAVHPFATVEVIETYAGYLDWLGKSPKTCYMDFLETAAHRGLDPTLNKDITDPHELDLLGIDKVRKFQGLQAKGLGWSAFQKGSTKGHGESNHEGTNARPSDPQSEEASTNGNRPDVGHGTPSAELGQAAQDAFNWFKPRNPP